LIKLVTIDLDGTLLDSRSEISIENRKAIKYCMDKGVKVCLSTGKSMRFAGRIIKDLGLKSLQIVSGGTMVVDPRLKPIYISKIPRRSVIDTVKLARHNNIGFVLDTTNGFLCYDKYYQELEHIFSSGEVKKKVNDMLSDHIVDSALLFTFTVSKDHFFNNILSKSISRDVKIRRGGTYFLNILKADAGKVAGLKKVIGAYGISQSQVMAIGDNNNDKGTLEFAGLSVAMGNATDEIKEMADFITADNDNNGVAEAIYKHIKQ